MISKQTVSSIKQLLDTWYPPSLSEAWDFPGLTFGSLTGEVRKVALAVDITPAVIEAATEAKADLLITHHPLLFRAEHLLGGDTFRGRMINQLAAANIAHISAHTNADSAAEGVADAAFDLLVGSEVEREPIVPIAPDEPLGLGRVGNLKTPTTLAKFAAHVSDQLKLHSIMPFERPVMYAGAPDAFVKRVAVLPGAGDSEFDAVHELGADVYVTSDLRHHPTQDQLSLDGLNLIDTPHAVIESLWLHKLKTKLEEYVPTEIISVTTDSWNLA